MKSILFFACVAFVQLCLCLPEGLLDLEMKALDEAQLQKKSNDLKSFETAKPELVDQLINIFRKLKPTSKNEDYMGVFIDLMALALQADLTKAKPSAVKILVKLSAKGANTKKLFSELEKVLNEKASTHVKGLMSIIKPSYDTKSTDAQRLEAAVDFSVSLYHTVLKVAKYDLCQQISGEYSHCKKYKKQLTKF